MPYPLGRPCPSEVALRFPSVLPSHLPYLHLRPGHLEYPPSLEPPQICSTSRHGIGPSGHRAFQCSTLEVSRQPRVRHGNPTELELAWLFWPLYSPEMGRPQPGGRPHLCYSPTGNSTLSSRTL